MKSNISFDKNSLSFQNDLKFIADRLFIPSLQMYINQQTAITGGAYPPLEPETIKRKSGQINKRIFTKSGKLRATASSKISKVGLTGFSSKTLIDTGKLISSFLSKKVGKSSVVIYLASDRADIGKYLQVDGVGKQNKRFNFFGISKNMEIDAIEYMKDKIKAVVSGK